MYNIEKTNIENKIYEIRGVQVMLDSDLAELYECETGNLNRARIRNKNRFPNNFAFQISKEEYINLKCQSGISKIDLRKINRNLPYVYTEQGVAMLSSVLHTEVAVKVSIDIINAFINMRKYISNNLYNMNIINTKLLEHDNRLTVVENTLNKLSEKKKANTIFFKGQIFDAYVVLMDICKKAKKEIIIIDNYAGKELFKLLKDIDKSITVITSNINEVDYNKYKTQYTNINIKTSDEFHDRFIIIDRKIIYHCGSSFKDLGEKCFALNLIEDKELVNPLINKIKNI